MGAQALHPLVEQVAERQLASLKIIYCVLAGLLVAILIVTLVLGDPLGPDLAAEVVWLEATLAGLSLLLLALVVPLSRRKMLATDRLRRADPQELTRVGLPEGIDPRIGRQAVYLTRYTAGCVISWGLCVSVGLYGLVARMMGSTGLVTGAFFAASAFVLLLLPPQRDRMFSALAEFLR